ncbi:MAG: hypothetical protein CBD86_03255 [Gammaproteobacteria bacterium TMED226]|nr:MAG: hypothetical protein CBD86_03255 [Gammaproteobacteria bacterium TMED226]
MSDFMDFNQLKTTEEKTDQLIFEEMKYFRDLVLNKNFSELYWYIESTSIYFLTPESVEERWENIHGDKS